MQLVFQPIFSILLPRQHHGMWTSQFPFLHSIKDAVLYSEACLYSCINWSLVEACHQSLLGVFQSSTSRKGIRVKPKLGSGFIYWNGICWHLVVPPWQRSLTMTLSLAVIRMAGSQVDIPLQVQQTSGRKKPWGLVFLMCNCLWLHHHHLNLLHRLMHFQTF